jgi:hypothetical protein
VRLVENHHFLFLVFHFVIRLPWLERGHQITKRNEVISEVGQDDMVTILKGGTSVNGG